MRFEASRNTTADSKNHNRIELNLHDTSQLFNSMDPAPFNDKDLDHDAEEFIVSWANEFSPEDPLKLRVHLELWPEDDPTELIQQAVHNYFAYRANLNQLEFRRLLRQGRTSLCIGLVFLFLCFLEVQYLNKNHTSAFAAFFRESLTIAGWVAMWRPMQIYLYDWWPIRRQGRIYTKLSSMPVEVIKRRKG
jgi:hypothetical protein